MYIDLNVPVPSTEQSQSSSQLKKGKGLAKQAPQQSKFLYSQAQLTAIENRVDLLTDLGYSVLAFNQVVQKRVDPKNHVNLVEGLVEQLRQRPGVVFLKRITIVLDEDSERGFGLGSSSTSMFNAYDIIALSPTTIGTFSLACLTHSQPSALTAHIISVPLTLPRLPFHLKHTLVRTAIKNGAVFEINYAGAFGTESDGSTGESAASTKRNWWASAREVVRVTKGKGLIVSGGVVNEADLRGSRDIANLITMLDLAQDLAQAASTKVPQSLILRAYTRKTYRAILSQPKQILPPTHTAPPRQTPPMQQTMEEMAETLDVPPTAPSPLRKRPLEVSEVPDDKAKKKKKKNRRK